LQTEFQNSAKDYKRLHLKLARCKAWVKEVPKTGPNDQHLRPKSQRVNRQAAIFIPTGHQSDAALAKAYAQTIDAPQL